MKNFYILLQKLIDRETKPNSILCFCKDLYEFKKASFEYHNASSKAIKMARYCDYNWYYTSVKDWLKTFHLQEKYIPEDFIDD